MTHARRNNLLNKEVSNSLRQFVNKEFSKKRKKNPR